MLVIGIVNEMKHICVIVTVNLFMVIGVFIIKCNIIIVNELIKKNILFSVIFEKYGVRDAINQVEKLRSHWDMLYLVIVFLEVLRQFIYNSSKMVLMHKSKLIDVKC